MPATAITVSEQPPLTAEGAKALALRSIAIMGDGTREDFDEVLHPAFINYEQYDEPPAARGSGPATAYATALWLRKAFADLRWDIHEVVAEGEMVVVHCTMSGRHVKPFVSYDEDGSVDEVFPPTGKRFATTQTHWLRIEAGQVIEHWANRDDLGMAKQLGWVPPTPAYLVRMALAKRRARKGANLLSDPTPTLWDSRLSRGRTHGQGAAEGGSGA
jgi:predicted ester cyclase